MKYGGSWAKGFAGAFDPVGGINLGLQWKEKKKAQKKIDDAIEQLKINSSTLATKYDAARADGSISQEEYGDAMAWAIPLGKEIMGKTKELYSNYQNMTSDQLQTEIDNINAILDYSAELDFANIEEMKAFGNKLTQPDAKMQWDLIIKSIEKRKVPPEVFTSAEAVREKYPEAGVRYTDKGYVPTLGEAEAPPTELDLMAENKKKLDYAYNTGNASYFNQTAKSMGVDTTFDTYKQGYEKPETGGGDKFDLNDFLFGSDGIMKEYGTTGGALNPEDIEAIKNNYKIKKNILTKANQKSVEEVLLKSGIDVNAVTPEEPIPEPEPQKPGIIDKIKGWLGQKPAPKESDYAGMTIDILYKLADEEDDILAYEELKRRGLIK